MKLLSPKDIQSAIITGLTTGIIAWRVLLFLDKSTVGGVPVIAFVFVVPILWLAGVQLGYLLGQFIGFFNQFGRFAAIGFTNFAVDAAVLNIFISQFHITEGIYFTLFKTASFTVALIHSYLWNRTWSFEQKKAGSASEFRNFAFVAILSLLVNVGIASLIAALPHTTVSDAVWANIASIVGSAAALVFSFFGYRLLVFSR